MWRDTLVFSRWCTSTIFSRHLDRKCSPFFGGKGGIHLSIFAFTNCLNVTLLWSTLDIFIIVQVSDPTSDDPVCLRFLPRPPSPCLWLWLPQDCTAGMKSHEKLYFFFNFSVCRLCVQMQWRSLFSLPTFTSLPMSRRSKLLRGRQRWGKMYRIYRRRSPNTKDHTLRIVFPEQQ